MISTRNNSGDLNRIVAIMMVFSSVVISEATVDSLHLRNATSLGAMLIIYNWFILTHSHRDVMAFLHPSAMGLNYLLVSMIVGAIGFHTGALVVPYMLVDPYYWGNTIAANIFFALTISIVMGFARYRYTWAFLPTAAPSIFRTGTVLISFFLIVAINIETGFFSGDQVVGAVFAVYILTVIPFRSPLQRALLYTIAFIPFAMAMSHSKREAIFFIYGITVLEVILLRVRKVSVKHVILGILAAVSLGFFILAITVVRASEVFSVNSAFDIFPAIVSYLQWQDFWAYFLLNIEATYTYFHVYQSIEMVSWGAIQLQWGLTYIKPLFFPIPRDIVDWKPNSAIDVYTTAFSPLLRQAGGSWVMSMLGEGYMNFKMAGAASCAGILLLFDWIFRRFVLDLRGRGLIVAAGAIYFSVATLTFVRGSGLDLAIFQFGVVVASMVPFALCMGYRRSLMQTHVRPPAEMDEDHESRKQPYIRGRRIA